MYMSVCVVHMHVCVCACVCDREHGQVQAEWQNQDGYETAAELWQMQYFRRRVLIGELKFR